MELKFFVIIYFILNLPIFLYTSDRVFQDFLYDKQGHLIYYSGKNVALRYKHYSDPVMLKLCACRLQCNSNCKIAGYCGKQIDQFVMVTILKKFIKALENEIPVNNNNGINMLLECLDLYDLHRFKLGRLEKSYVAKLCDGHYMTATSPIHYVAGNHNDTQAAQVLLENGACLNRLDEQDNYPLDCAVSKDGHNQSMIQLLITYGGKCNKIESIKTLQRLGVIKKIPSFYEPEV